MVTIIASHGARELSKHRVSEWLQMAQERGVGEVFITSIDTKAATVVFLKNLP